MANPQPPVDICVGGSSSINYDIVPRTAVTTAQATRRGAVTVYVETPVRVDTRSVVTAATQMYGASNTSECRDLRTREEQQASCKGEEKEEQGVSAQTLVLQYQNRKSAALKEHGHSN